MNFPHVQKLLPLWCLSWLWKKTITEVLEFHYIFIKNKHLLHFYEISTSTKQTLSDSRYDYISINTSKQLISFFSVSEFYK